MHPPPEEHRPPLREPDYVRQVAFAPIGEDGQKRLAAASVLIVGAGGLGSWAAELLARAGVGRLRLVDDDRVEPHNLHRQAMYTLEDARRGRPKVLAAAAALGAIRPEMALDARCRRVEAGNVAELAAGMDVIFDGTDRFASRFVINDFAVAAGRPWVFAGVVGSEGQVLPVLPGRTACLRCLFDSPPVEGSYPTCREVGVLGPAVATISSIAVMEAMKILLGRCESAGPRLLKLDLWNNRVQRLDALELRRSECPCCGEGGRR